MKMELYHVQKTSNYSEADQVKCGSSSPDIFGGFSTVLRWKDIDLNAVFGYLSESKCLIILARMIQTEHITIEIK